jgi:hypothetical protein
MEELVLHIFSSSLLCRKSIIDAGVHLFFEPDLLPLKRGKKRCLFPLVTHFKLCASNVLPHT